ncbi:hypothetical protein C2G38_2035972 [Gigaspora rosea]|uniref:Uncharacterized protein n=1 Tax=Gigaspora rosea TaxID=44941 RepID=A0A397VAN0_9GLOM|nr:hypothetical protein C2G38_2035972 [Gigaspora rosea]
MPSLFSRYTKTAAFHISMVPQRWHKDIYQDVPNLQENILYNYERNNETMDEGILPTQKPAMIPTTVPTIRKAAHKRTLYGRVWGFARTATLLAAEQEDDEITTFLQDYIKRKSNQNTQKRPAIDEIPTIDERPEADKRPVIRERPLVDERSTIDEMPNNVPELNEDNNESESNEMEDEIINLNLQGVKNPNKVTGRGRPPKRRYLSSVEKEQSTRGGSKTRGSYKCGVCQQVGHNATFHKGTRK